MNVREIVRDSVNYPISDWKKILILGIIIVISGISSVAVLLNTKNVVLISVLVVVDVIVGFLVNGYLFKIVEFSLDNKVGLPDFNNWAAMCIDGIKVFIVFLVYLIIPVMALIFIVLSSLGEAPFTVLSISILGNMDPSGLIVSVIWPTFLNFIVILYDFFLPGGIFALIYAVIVVPIFLVAIANMAYYEGEFSSAFRFGEIIDEIRGIGWNELLKWYTATGILFLFLFGIGVVISYIFSSIYNLELIIGLLMSLTLIPYIYMYLARSVALFYMPGEE
jgi:hypothetical protein